MRLLQRSVTSACVLLFCACHVCAQDGVALYKKNCALCHDASAERVPSRDTLKAMSPERVLAVMESGVMITMASHLSSLERRAIAEFVTGKSLGHALQLAPLPRAMCAGAPGAFSESPTGTQWNAWGANIANTRYTDAAAGFAAAELPRLKLKWAFGFPGDNGESAQPTTAGGHVFVGSQGGKVYSLSAETGCVYWWFEAAAPVRTAIVIGRIETESGPSHAAFFGDLSGSAYAVSADTGKLLWKVKAESHPAARITGTPAFYRGRLYVPVSSNEEGTAIAPDYPCCSFRGSVVALDGATGKQVWKTYTIREEARPTIKNT